MSPPYLDFTMNLQHENSLLRTIGAAGIEDLRAHLVVRELKQEQVIADTGEQLKSVYFPHSAVLSCVVGLSDGGAVAGGLIGKDGAFGAVQALDSMVSLNKVFVMVPGTASVIEARHLVDIAQRIPALRRILLTYEQFFLAQVQQTAACNALHDIPMRTCRWLLRMEELAGRSFPLTQEALALMMGVRRTTLTSIASKMQSEGLISYRRGRMELVNMEAIRKVACECQAELESHHELVFKQLKREVIPSRLRREGNDPRGGNEVRS
jgi:CRP-like cAMP-binding protein